MGLADNAFRKDHDFYIGPRDKGIGNRRERVLQNVENSSLMYAPKVSLTKSHNDDVVMSFDDGRHRFAVLRDLGVETINLTFNADSKELIPLLQKGGAGLGEGTGDAYAERKWGIPDVNPQWEKRADQSRYDPAMGEMVGHTKNSNPNSSTPIFKNPTDLKNFDNHTRATSDADGNVFVAQGNDDFVHGAFTNVMRSDPYDNSINITWHRVGGSNVFGLSDSFSINRNRDGIEKRLDVLRRKNPNFRFVPELYFDVDPEEDEIAKQKQHEPMLHFESVIKEEIVKLNEAGYYDDEGVIKLYHRVGVKGASSYPELIKSVETKGLIRSDNGEVGDVIWFSNNASDYGDNGLFVVALDFDTATNGVTNNQYGIVYQGHNAFAHQNIGFEDLEVLKIPVGVIGHDHHLTNVDAIKYINDENFFTAEAINAGKFKIVIYKDVFNKYVQPYINIPDFLSQLSPEKLMEGVGDKYAEKAFGIPDADKQYDAKGVPDADMGEKVSPIWATNYGGEKKYYGDIYKNPKTLRGFDADVRAIAMDDGDIYVAQNNGDFIHVDLELAIEKVEGPLGEYYEFHRVGTRNEFGASDTLIHKIQDYALDMQYVIEELNTRHPNFEFSDKYYMLLKNSINEVEDNCLHVPDEMPS